MSTLAVIDVGRRLNIFTYANVGMMILDLVVDDISVVQLLTMENHVLALREDGVLISVIPSQDPNEVGIPGIHSGRHYFIDEIATDVVCIATYSFGTFMFLQGDGTVSMMGANEFYHPQLSANKIDIDEPAIGIADKLIIMPNYSYYIAYQQLRGILPIKVDYPVPGRQADTQIIRADFMKVDGVKYRAFYDRATLSAGCKTAERIVVDGLDIDDLICKIIIGAGRAKGYLTVDGNLYTQWDEIRMFASNVVDFSIMKNSSVITINDQGQLLADGNLIDTPTEMLRLSGSRPLTRSWTRKRALHGQPG